MEVETETGTVEGLIASLRTRVRLPPVDRSPVEAQFSEVREKVEDESERVQVSRVPDPSSQ